ncbi:MAG: double-strand break repair protein AddB [Rhodospirillales bacterium]|nr:double-strand break repair protein AddB [Rhodospirillales bacterium]
MSAGGPNITTIPAGLPFSRLLAADLLNQYKARENHLSEVLILLPTRRACRVLQDSFLELRGSKPMILPRLQPIGDLDEEELSLSITGQSGGDHAWSLPGALPPLQRQILLAKLIRQIHQDESSPLGQSHEQSLKLARALGQLMDHIYTENLDMADLAGLVPEDFAEHWQITLKFLEILSEHWPKILAEKHLIDAADRRNRLILALAKFWQTNPPATPVIGAGSTGSIPATARLLSVIAHLPKGQVILPGYDPHIDMDSWNALSESHPQYGFKQLLTHMKAQREDVTLFKGANSNEHALNRQFLTRELMRPAQTAERWADIITNENAVQTVSSALKNLTRITCAQPREEAEAIALMMRQTLENPGQTACLITPDRELAARVASACSRWSITIDDSAGQSLHRLPLGIYLRAILEACTQNFAPIALLSLLKHGLCQTGKPEHIAALDLSLRGNKPSPGFAGLRTHIENRERLDKDTRTHALEFLSQLETIFAPITELSKTPASFTKWLSAHLTLAEGLSTNQHQSGAEILWYGETGRHASRFFAELFEHTQNLEALSLRDYAAILSHFMDQSQIRPAFGTHPRLQILGTLEARLIDADLVILGGLNEGTWPPEPAADPWMSRPMRKEFGLPAPERSIGLAAHDFVQGLCAPRVVLIRAENQDGAPTVPARWLQRLDAVLQAAQITSPQNDDLLHWARQLDYAPNIKPIAAPAPRPPLEARPRRLSVTKIETWLRDPYAIYARYILGLKPLDPLEKPIDAAERGQLLHKILERYVLETRESLPAGSDARLLEIAREEIDARRDDPHLWNFWGPRFAKTARWLDSHERDWRAATRNLAVEAEGAIDIPAAGGNFKLTAIADRIDLMADGTAALIDYKSGGTYTPKAIETGALPQLALEALILEHGGFEGLQARKTGSLQYWVLNGSGAGAKLTNYDKDIDTLTAQTAERLTALIARYDDPTMPYLCQPRPDQAPRFNDYEHFERIREWGLSAENEDTEAA